MAVASTLYGPPLAGTSTLSSPATVSGTSTSTLALHTTTKGVKLELTESTGVLALAADSSWAGLTIDQSVTLGSLAKMIIDSSQSKTTVALQISGDPNTGVAQSTDGADSLSIITGGNEIIRCNTAASSTGITLFGSTSMQASKVFRFDSAVSTAAVALQVSGDPNTGVAAVGGADTLSVVAGGTETVRIGNATFGIFSKNATPAAQQTSGANVTNNVTSGGTDDTIANYTDLTIYANDSAAIRNDIYQLARKMKQLNDGMRTLGWFT